MIKPTMAPIIPDYSTDGELSVNVGSLQPWLAAKSFGS